MSEKINYALHCSDRFIAAWDASDEPNYTARLEVAISNLRRSLKAVRRAGEMPLPMRTPAKAGAQR